MEVEIGRGKKARRAYGFDDIAIVPSRRTRDPDDIDISWTLGPYRFELPLLAAALDGVVSPESAGIIGKLGGLTPRAIRTHLGLNKPIYRKSAAYGHFGRTPEGDLFPWERTDLVDALKAALG